MGPSNYPDRGASEQGACGRSRNRKPEGPFSPSAHGAGGCTGSGEPASSRAPPSSLAGVGRRGVGGHFVLTVPRSGEEGDGAACPAPDPQPGMCRPQAPPGPAAPGPLQDTPGEPTRPEQDPSVLSWQGDPSRAHTPLPGPPPLPGLCSRRAQGRREQKGGKGCGPGPSTAVGGGGTPSAEAGRHPPPRTSRAPVPLGTPDPRLSQAGGQQGHQGGSWPRFQSRWNF